MQIKRSFFKALAKGLQKSFGALKGNLHVGLFCSEAQSLRKVRGALFGVVYGLFSKLWALMVIHDIAAPNIFGAPEWEPNCGNYRYDNHIHRPDQAQNTHKEPCGW